MKLKVDNKEVKDLINNRSVGGRTSHGQGTMDSFEKPENNVSVPCCTVAVQSVF
jgi:hypothetical protein